MKNQLVVALLLLLLSLSAHITVAIDEADGDEDGLHPLVEFQGHSTNDLREFVSFIRKGVRYFKVDPHYVHSYEICKQAPDVTVINDGHCLLLAHDAPRMIEKNSTVSRYDSIDSLLGILALESTAAMLKASDELSRMKKEKGKDGMSSPTNKLTIQLCFKSAPLPCGLLDKDWERLIDNFYDKATALQKALKDIIELEFVLDGDGKPHSCRKDKWKPWKSTWIVTDHPGSPLAALYDNNANMGYDRFAILNNPDNYESWKYFHSNNYFKFGTMTEYPLQLWEPSSQPMIHKFIQLLAPTNTLPEDSIPIIGDVSSELKTTRYLRSRDNQPLSRKLTFASNLDPAMFSLFANAKGAFNHRLTTHDPRAANFTQRLGNPLQAALKFNKFMSMVFTFFPKVSSPTSVESLSYTVAHVRTSETSLGSVVNPVPKSDSTMFNIQLDTTMVAPLSISTIIEENIVLIADATGKVVTLAISIDKSNADTEPSHQISIKSIDSIKNPFIDMDSINARCISLNALPKSAKNKENIITTGWISDNDFGNKCEYFVLMTKGVKGSIISGGCTSIPSDFKNFGDDSRPSKDLVEVVMDAVPITVSNSDIEKHALVAFSDTIDLYLAIVPMQQFSSLKDIKPIIGKKIGVGTHPRFAVSYHTINTQIVAQVIGLVVMNGYCYNCDLHNKRSYPEVCDAYPVPKSGALDYTIGTSSHWVSHFQLELTHSALDYISPCTEGFLHGTFDIGIYPHAVFLPLDYDTSVQHDESGKVLTEKLYGGTSFSIAYRSDDSTWIPDSICGESKWKDAMVQSFLPVKSSETFKIATNSKDSKVPYQLAEEILSLLD